MMFGVFPGYARPGANFEWMSAIGLTIPFEIVAEALVKTVQAVLGLEPSTPFIVGEELEG